MAESASAGDGRLTVDSSIALMLGLGAYERSRRGRRCRIVMGRGLRSPGERMSGTLVGKRERRPTRRQTSRSTRDRALADCPRFGPCDILPTRPAGAVRPRPDETESTFARRGRP
jgi:hypothetical protein